MAKDNRATVEAARKTARSRIIASIIGAVAIIVVALLSIFLSKKEKVNSDFFRTINNNTLKNMDTVGISKKLIEQTEKDTDIFFESNIDYSSELKDIENLINHQQYPQAYRAYLDFYDSLPLDKRKIVNQRDIKKTKDKYELGRCKEAALLMKEYIDSIVQN